MKKELHKELKEEKKDGDTLIKELDKDLRSL